MRRRCQAPVNEASLPGPGGGRRGAARLRRRGSGCGGRPPGPRRGGERGRRAVRPAATGGHDSPPIATPAGGGGHGSQVSRSPLRAEQGGHPPCSCSSPSPFTRCEMLPARSRVCLHRFLQTLRVSASPECFFSLRRDSSAEGAAARPARRRTGTAAPPGAARPGLGRGGGPAHESSADTRTLLTGVLLAHGVLPLASLGSSGKQKDNTGTLQGISFIVKMTTVIFYFIF